MAKTSDVVLTLSGILFLLLTATFLGAIFFDVPFENPFAKTVTQQVVPGTGGQLIVPSGGATQVACGKDASFTAIARDIEASSVTGTNVPVYLVRHPWDNPSASQLTNPTGTALDTDGVAFSSGFATCDTVDAIAFNGTYYGDWFRGYKVGQGGTLELNVHRVTPAGNFKWTLGSDVVFADEDPGDVNLTGMTANGGKSLRKLELKLNGTYHTYKLGSFYADRVSTSTNISKIDFAGTPISSKGVQLVPGTWFPGKSGAISSGRQDTIDFQFDVLSPDGNRWTYLRPGDYIDVVNNLFTADGDGCGSADTADRINVRVADVQNYVSRDGVSIFEGTENDANSPADTGSGDSTAPAFYCRSGTGG